MAAAPPPPSDRATKRSITPPKGRPTRARHESTPRRFRQSSRVQWAIVGVIFVAILIGAYLIARNQEPRTFQGRSGAAPVAHVVPELPPPLPPIDSS